MLARYDRQRENRGAEEEQDYSRSLFGPPLRTSACEWIGHRVEWISHRARVAARGPLGRRRLR
jgi:hypothetical protein